MATFEAGDWVVIRMGQITRVAVLEGLVGKPPLLRWARFYRGFSHGFSRTIVEPTDIIGTAWPTKRLREAKALSIICPECGQDVGRPCPRLRRRRLHDSRFISAGV